MCKKETSVSHISTEAEIIFLHAGLRMDGLPALDLWDLVTEGFHSSFNPLKTSKGRVQGNLLRNTPTNKHTRNQTKVPIKHINVDLTDVDHISSNVKPSGSNAMLYVSEDN